MSDPLRRPAMRDDLALVEGYHSPQVEVEVRLNTNETPQPPPAELRAELAEAAALIEWNRYPDRAATRLREALAALHGVSPGCVFAANGSNEVIQALCLAYAGQGRRVAVFEPTYAMHSHIARISGAEVVVGERGGGFELEEAELVKVLRGHEPAVTFLCSPNNPTGMVEPELLVREAVALAAGWGGMVVVDEAYGQFAHWNALDLVGEESPLVVTRTYSKTWAMAGARLGYLVGPSWVLPDLEKVVLPYHLDAFTQLAGTLALRHVAAMEERVAEVVVERERVAAALGELPVEVWPSEANFILLRPRLRAGAEVWRELLERSILVRDCSSWPRLEGCLRVTLGTRSEDDRFLEALREILT